MTDKVSFPPLHDLSPGELEMRKQHLLSEIGRKPERARLSRPISTFSRRRVALALAVCVAAAVPAAVFGGLFSSSNPAPTSGPNVAETTDIWKDFGGNPFGMGAEQISYDQLHAQAPYIPLPDSPLANAGNAAGTVWIITAEVLREQSIPAPGNGLVGAGIYYPSSGIELVWYYGPHDYLHGSTPDQRQTVDGVTALVLAHVRQTDVAQVTLPVGDNRLTLEGLTPGVSTDELVSVAQTLSPSPSPTP